MCLILVSTGGHYSSFLIIYNYQRYAVGVCVCGVCMVLSLPRPKSLSRPQQSRRTNKQTFTYWDCRCARWTCNRSEIRVLQVRHL